MSFLVLLLALLVEKFSALRQRVQRDEPWLRELARLERHRRIAAHPWLLLALAVLVPLLAVWLVLWVVGSVAYGWLALPVHLLVLVYSFGRGTLPDALGPFRDACRRGDQEAAVLVAWRDLGVKADNGEQLMAGVQRYLLWQAFQGFFVVIFWYVLLGPAAALGYRLLALAAERATSPLVVERAAQLRHALEWLPARFMALSFALVGNFVAVTRAMLHDLLNWNLDNASFVTRAGCVASEVSAPLQGVDGASTLDVLWQLLVRAAIVWYAGIALWTLFA